MVSRRDLVLLVALIQTASAAGTGSSSSGSSGSSSGSSGSSSNSSSSSSKASAPTGPSNESLGHDFLVALSAFIGVLLVYRIILVAVQHARHLASLNNGTQRYFAIPNPTWASVKNNILYAPLFRKRHNHEFQLSSAINMGTLPTRFQTLFMIAVIAANTTLCVYNLPWSGPSSTVYTMLFKRSGNLAILNMIPLVIMAGRTNPLIRWLNISYDTFNMMHRLFGRIVTLEAIIHTITWIVPKVQSKGWGVVGTYITSGGMATTGLIGTIALVVIIIQAYSPIRHAFYETFLNLHIILAIVGTVFIWIHVAGLHAQWWLLGAIVCWAAERTIRAATLVYRNIGNGGTKATIEALPGDAVRMTIKVARPWRFTPGQYFFITVPSVGLWSSHPFSIAWSDVEDPFSSGVATPDEKGGLVLTRQDLVKIAPNTFSAVIRRRTGFTNSLFRKAEQAGAFDGNKLTVTAYVNGPYGLPRSLASYGTVMLFAGGVGITHQVPYVRELVAGYADGTVATRKVVLVWVIQTPEHLEWIRPWMTSVLGMERRREVLSIKLFITRPRSAKEVHSPSSTVQMFPGRPGIDTLIAKECESQVGAMAVTVCGTGALQDEVRKVCRDRGQWSNIDYIEESFSW